MLRYASVFIMSWIPVECAELLKSIRIHCIPLRAHGNSSPTTKECFEALEGLILRAFHNKHSAQNIFLYRALAQLRNGPI